MCREVVGECSQEQQLLGSERGKAGQKGELSYDAAATEASAELTGPSGAGMEFQSFQNCGKRLDLLYLSID